mmetsp:Transcript_96513/g.242095  ORF Transcript_96513/g.242095 Transcript_96513/m.242095 type:complete len:200 (+) Transcript_96513:105-704(+)
MSLQETTLAARFRFFTAPDVVAFAFLLVLGVVSTLSPSAGAFALSFSELFLLVFAFFVFPFGGPSMAIAALGSINGDMTNLLDSFADEPVFAALSSATFSSFCSGFLGFFFSSIGTNFTPFRAAIASLLNFDPLMAFFLGFWAGELSSCSWAMSAPSNLAVSLKASLFFFGTPSLEEAATTRTRSTSLTSAGALRSMSL